MASVEPVLSSAKQRDIKKYNDIICQKSGPNCGVECIDILCTKTRGKRIKKKTTLTLRRTGCKSIREIDSESLTTNRRTFDITSGFNLCNDDNTCALCEDQSCVKLSQEYQNDRTLYPRGGKWNTEINGNARQVNKNSSDKKTFTCINPLCKHSYLMSPSKIINEKRGCPYCSRGAKEICGKIYCIPCTNKSLTTRPNIMKAWSSKNTTPPHAIMKTSNQDIWLDCPCCGIPYERNIRTINNTCELICTPCKNNSVIIREIDCIECNLPFMRRAEGQTKCQCCRGVDSPSSPLCSNNDCKKCYDRSFAKRIEDDGIGSLIFREDLNKCTPRNISRQSGQEYMFYCDLCNQIISTQLHKPIVCCTNCSGNFNTENYIRDILSDIYGKPFTKTRSLRWLNDDGTPLELDGYNEELKIAFEYQGEQHYKLTHYNGNDSMKLLDIQRKDALKIKLCKENGVKLIIVSCDMPLSKYKEYLTPSNEVVEETEIQNVMVASPIPEIVVNPRVRRIIVVNRLPTK